MHYVCCVVIFRGEETLAECPFCHDKWAGPHSRSSHVCSYCTLPAHYLRQNNALQKYNFVDMIATFPLFVILTEAQKTLCQLGAYVIFH